MKLIILYGAPGVGKYTIAKKLKQKTGYKLLHIHSIYDFLEDIFGKDKYEVSLSILQKTALDIFINAAKEKLPGLIFTYAHLAENNFSFAKTIETKLKKYNSKIYFIHLACDEKILEKRVVNKARKKFRKTKTTKELKYLLATKNYQSSYRPNKNLKIDTSNISSQKIADQISKLLT